MSVVLTRDVKRGQEILVSYNYRIQSAPTWYKQLWEQHSNNKNIKAKINSAE